MRRPRRLPGNTSWLRWAPLSRSPSPWSAAWPALRSSLLSPASTRLRARTDTDGPTDPAIERQSAQNATSTIANLILPGSLGLSVPDNPKSAEKIRESRAILRARYGSLYDDVLGFWRNTIRSGLHR